MTTDRLAGFGATPPAAQPRGRRFLAQALARPSLATLVVLVVVVLFFALRTPRLLTSSGITGVLDVAATLGIGGVAVALLLIAGQFDLTIGAVAVGSSVVTALLVGQAGWAIWPALLVSLAAALGVGIVNGMLVVATGLPSFLVTLATFLVLEGATAAGAGLVGGPGARALASAAGWRWAVDVFSSTLSLGSLHLPAWVLWWLAVTALASWVLWRTKFGNAVFASGGARRAAREMGLAVRRTTVSLFCVTAAAGWLFGTVSLVRFGRVELTADLTTEVDFIIVAVLGGSLITGGYGSVVGSALGALLYAVTQAGILLAGWDVRWFETVLGVLLLAALLVNGVVRQRLKAVPRS